MGYPIGLCRRPVARYSSGWRIQLRWYDKKKPSPPPPFDLVCGKLWSYVNMLTQAMRKNMLIGSTIAMATYWCIRVLGFSALRLSTNISIVTEGR